MGLLQVPTLDQAIAIVRGRIRANNKNLSTLPGSVFGDVAVIPQAISDTQQKALTYYNAVLTSGIELLALKSDVNTLALMAAALNTTVNAVLLDISLWIDKWAAKFSETRKQPTQSIVNLYFGRTDPPTQDYVIPIGAIARGSNGATYVTVGTVTMFAANAATYYDPNLLLFVVAVPAQAVLSGSSGDAPAQTITSIVTPITGFNQVTNLGNAEGGQDIETDEAFVARVLLKWQGVGGTTLAGIVGAIMDNTDVQSVYPAPPKNAFNIRGFGRTDVYIQKRVEEQFTETFSAFNHPTIPNAVQPSNLPLANLLSASSGIAQLQLDTTSALRGSVQSLDAIRFTLAAPVFPVTITYTRNKRVSEAQNVFNDPSHGPENQQDPVDSLSAIETPILIHQAPQLVVDYTNTIIVAPGQVKSQVVSAVKQNILTFFGELNIGDSLFVDDLNKVVEATTGVLRLSGQATKFSPVNQAGVLDVITPDRNAVIVIGTLNIF